MPHSQPRKSKRTVINFVKKGKKKKNRQKITNLCALHNFQTMIKSKRKANETENLSIRTSTQDTGREKSNALTVPALKLKLSITLEVRRGILSALPNGGALTNTWQSCRRIPLPRTA